jgi:hypothetical protein
MREQNIGALLSLITNDLISIELKSQTIMIIFSFIFIVILSSYILYSRHGPLGIVLVFIMIMLIPFQFIVAGAAHK